ncbi:MAG: rhodanese-like domain-containing protein, partial [Janthinobacterium sp.]
VECGASHVYLLGQRFAFIGSLAPEALTPLLEAALVTPDTVLCASGDDGGICGTLRAAREGEAAASELQLDAAALPAFLRQHPDAILVDVREAYEHAACAGTVFEGCAVHSVPLSRLAGQVAAWLQQPQRPLVFFCRSGNRSARAAACLRRLGHGAAWQLNGGMAMADATRHALAIAA